MKTTSHISAKSIAVSVLGTIVLASFLAATSEANSQVSTVSRMVWSLVGEVREGDSSPNKPIKVHENWMSDFEIKVLVKRAYPKATKINIKRGIKSASVKFTSGYPTNFVGRFYLSFEGKGH